MQTALISPIGRFREISKRLYALHGDLSSMVYIETLFFEALQLSRAHHEELHRTEVLQNLLSIKEKEYKLSQGYYRSTKSKEKYIRNFKHYFKKTLDKAIADYAK